MPRRVQRACVVKQVQAEVDERARHLLAIDEQVLLEEVPAARAHEQHRDLRIRRYCLPSGVLNPIVRVDRVAQVDLAVDDVVPGRRERVLAVRHEHFRARVQRIDDHLAIGRTGDLDAPILQVRRDRSRRASRIRGCGASRQEIGKPARRRSRCCRRSRASSNSCTRGVKRRASAATNSSASRLRMLSKPAGMAPRISQPADVVSEPWGLNRSPTELPECARSRGRFDGADWCNAEYATPLYGGKLAGSCAINDVSSIPQAISRPESLHRR